MLEDKKIYVDLYAWPIYVLRERLSEIDRQIQRLKLEYQEIAQEIERRDRCDKQRNRA